MKPPVFRCLLIFLLHTIALGRIVCAADAAPVSFRRDLAPLLQRRCAACHCEDSAKGGYVADADIKVFDSLGGEPSAGRTDPRGVFQASDISGHATVVVRHGDTRYAFLRTVETLRPALRPQPAPTSPAPTSPAQRDRAPSPVAKPKGMSKEDYISNVKLQLKGNQMENKSSWEEKVSKGGKGVEAQKALKK